MKPVCRTICKDVCVTENKCVTKTVCEPVTQCKEISKKVERVECESYCVKGHLSLSFDAPADDCSCDPCDSQNVKHRILHRLCLTRTPDEIRTRQVTKYDTVTETMPVTKMVKRKVTESVPVTTTKKVHRNRDRDGAGQNRAKRDPDHHGESADASDAET